MDASTIVAAGGVSVAAVALFLNRTISKQASDIAGRVLALEKVMDMVIKNLTVSFVVEKHRPHPEFQAQDKLIEKFAQGTITSDEQAEFLRMIEADSTDLGGEVANRLFANAILDLWAARDIVHASSPAFTQLSPGEKMLSTMKALNSDTKQWLAVKIARENDATTAVGKQPAQKDDDADAT